MTATKIRLSQERKKDDLIINKDKNNDKIVVLMHDTDKNINEAEFLNEAIIYLKDLGYEFRTLK